MLKHLGPNLRLRKSPSASSDLVFRFGIIRSSAARALPSGLINPVRRKGIICVGIPSISPAGIR